MTKQEIFADAVFDFLLTAEILDEENAESIAVECDGKQIETGFVIPLTPSDIKLVVCPRVEIKDIFLALTDGPEHDILLLLEELTRRAAENEKFHWHSVDEISIDFFNSFGVYGLYYNKLKFVELFESIGDHFYHNNQRYNLKAVMFLSKEETECYFADHSSDKDKFFALVEDKDPIKFSQVE